MDRTIEPTEALPAAERFDAIYHRHYDRMVRLATLLVDHQAIAEELVQDSFRRVWQRFDDVEEPLHYLRRTVVNACHQELRRRRVRRRHPDGGGDEATPGGEEYLLDALLAVPIRRRTALVLRYYGGFTMAEIADAMGVAEGTAKSMIHRGLNDLRRQLT